MGEHCGAYINRQVQAYDDFRELTDSVLGSRSDPRKHRQTAPTIHGRVTINRHWPDFSGESRRMLFCALGRDITEPLETLRTELLEETMLVGRHEVLRALAKARKLKYLVIAHWQDWIAVRAEL